MVLLICPCRDIKLKCKDFSEAYNELKKIYLGFWDEEEWNEAYNISEREAEFEADGYIEFCDGDAIMTAEQFFETYFENP